MLTTPPSSPTRSTRRSGRFVLTLDHVWLAAALMLIALRPLLTPIPPNDFWWHMATGRATLAAGGVPRVDSFSYTQFGQPFFNQGWLAQLLMYGLYQLGGLPLIIIAQALVIALAYGLLLRLCLRRTGQVQLSVGLLLLTTLPLSFDNWLVRPQSYAFPLFVGFLTILTEYRLGIKSRLWLLPPLMILWANIHGSFVLGGVLIAATLVGEWLKRRIAAWREATSWASKPIGAPEDVLTRPAPERPPALLPLLLWGAATALALLINPRGLEVIGYVRNLLSTSAVTNLVTEWAPPIIRDPGGIIFFLFLCLCIAILTYARRRPDLTDFLLFYTFLWNALSASRNIVWFGFVATLLVVVQAATLLGTPRSARGVVGSPTLNAVLIGMLGLLLAIALPWWKPALLPPSVGALLSEDTPVAAVDYMRAQPDRSRRLFHTEAYGSYLIWHAPEQPVFIDTRIELYPIEQWRDYIDLGQGKNTAALLEKYAIDGLLLDTVRQKPLIAFARRDGGWVERYKDEHTVYFTRAAQP
ncbi:MAG TPA: hypothetical protein VFU22_15650 [Roseiflexaceae bacterium]|nr:hypothetical protein [Roseiflexaceae bacterium]